MPVSVIEKCQVCIMHSQLVMALVAIASGLAVIGIVRWRSTVRRRKRDRELALALKDRLLPWLERFAERLAASERVSFTRLIDRQDSSERWHASVHMEDDTSWYLHVSRDGEGMRISCSEHAGQTVTRASYPEMFRRFQPEPWLAERLAAIESGASVRDADRRKQEREMRARF
jgi:hypothetical protein